MDTDHDNDNLHLEDADSRLNDSGGHQGDGRK
jgi:hypothetical protein